MDDEPHNPPSTDGPSPGGDPAPESGVTRDSGGPTAGGLGKGDPEKPLTTADPIRIRVGVPKAYQSQAGSLICVAFFRQLARQVCNQPETIRIFQREFDPHLSVCATAGDKLVGLITLKHGGIPRGTHTAVGPRLSTFVRQFGYLGGPVRFALQQLLMNTKPHKRNELIVEAMAVDEDYRDRGIGARLMRAAFEFARESGISSIRLEVVDTNPDARRFYERMGFVAVSTHAPRHMLERLGFSAVTTMVKKIP